MPLDIEIVIIHINKKRSGTKNATIVTNWDILVEIILSLSDGLIDQLNAKVKEKDKVEDL